MSQGIWNHGLRSPRARSLDRGDIGIAVSSLGQVWKAPDGSADIFDLADVVAPLDDQFCSNLRGLVIDAPHGEHFPEMIAVGCS
jgi:hypothetical protein